MDYVLQTNELTKNYGGTSVVNKVSLSIKKGDIYGFVGKNGAGKTTFIRLILGLTEASSGSFTLFSGSDVKNARKKIGSLVEAPALYTNMTAYENLDLYCTMLGADKKSIDEILKIVGLSDTGKKKVKNFSLGMKQRLGIGMALVGEPEFIVLDEPINGLDPTGIVEIRELILNLKNKYGKTIFISSHILGELEKIATCYGIISKGRLVEEITAEELAEKCGTQTVIQTDNPQKTAEIISEMLKDVKVSISPEQSVILDSKAENIGELTNKLFQSGIMVKGIFTHENNAEAYFVAKMEEK